MRVLGIISLMIGLLFEVMSKQGVIKQIKDGINTDLEKDCGITPQIREKYNL